jgi:type IV secretory pathway VirB2 component (pilin)
VICHPYRRRLRRDWSRAFVLAATLALAVAAPTVAAPGGGAQNPAVEMTENVKDTVVGGAGNLYVVALIIVTFIAVVIWRSAPRLVMVLIIMALLAPVVMNSGRVSNTLKNMGNAIWPGGGGQGTSESQGGGRNTPDPYVP